MLNVKDKTRYVRINFRSSFAQTELSAQRKSQLSAEQKVRSETRQKKRLYFLD